jgi:Fe-S cluster assembly protein SufD
MSAVEIRPTASKEKELYLADYAALRGDSSRDPAWLRGLRERAISNFQHLSFPGVRDEDWKYTSVAPILKVPFRSSTVPAAADLRKAGDAARRATPAGATGLVFVNGHHAADLSSGLDGRATVAALSALPDLGGRLAEPHLGRYASYDRVTFTALNQALLGDVAVIHIPKNQTVADPIHVTFVSTSEEGVTGSHTRVLVVADEGARATVVETYVGIGQQQYLTNAVTEIALGDGASVEHIKLLQESERAFHVGTTQVHQGRDSNLASIAITMGAALARNDLNVVLAGQGAACTLHGLYLTSGIQHVDNHTAIEHAAPHGTSRQVYKGILDGASRAVFNGKVFVQKDAQHTDAQQTNRNLLLSGEATIDTKPQLEILADDVKCTHGAAIGQLDEEALFYLRSRAMSEQTARSLLTYAFASEVVERITAEPLRVQLDEQLRSRLLQGGQD